MKKFARPFPLLMLGVAAWGLFHAFGSYYGGIDRSGDNFLQHDWRRFAVVAAFTAAFLLFWGAMLTSRRRRLEREANDADRETS